MKTNPTTVCLPVKTTEGEFIAHYSEAGLAELDWPVGRASSRAVAKKIVSAKIRAWHRLTKSALQKILAGKPAGKLPPLDWTGKTEFQQSVWRALLKISPGKTRSYGEIAVTIGNPKAIRAVGGACGANPIPVIVPCHRVLAANRKIGGFSGGLGRKRSLLEREGIVF
jgi:O-6-methylguanine DNA methyltransferase